MYAMATFLSALLFSAGDPLLVSSQRQFLEMDFMIFIALECSAKDLT
jgi:hypothetical protein